jgi:hypothetical protein
MQQLSGCNRFPKEVVTASGDGSKCPPPRMDNRCLPPPCRHSGHNQSSIRSFARPMPRPGGDPQPQSEPPTFAEPPLLGSKADAGPYTPSAPWLTYVILQSTEAQKQIESECALLQRGSMPKRIIMVC